jgi:hypothetical protein
MKDLLPPPALSECGHRSLALVCGCAMLAKRIFSGLVLRAPTFGQFILAHLVNHSWSQRDLRTVFGVSSRFFEQPEGTRSGRAHLGPRLTMTSDAAARGAILCGSGRTHKQGTIR